MASLLPLCNVNQYKLLKDLTMRLVVQADLSWSYGMVGAGQHLKTPSLVGEHLCCVAE